MRVLPSIAVLLAASTLSYLYWPRLARCLPRRWCIVSWVLLSLAASLAMLDFSLVPLFPFFFGLFAGSFLSREAGS